MTPTPYSIELFEQSLRVDSGEVRVRALVYSDAVGYDALLTYEDGVCACSVTEVSRGPDTGYVPVLPSAELDEAVRRICDCDPDLAEQLALHLENYRLDERYEEESREYCASGCRSCLGGWL